MNLGWKEAQFDYERRSTWMVHVGDTPLGGVNPIRVQSMANTSTMDTQESVSQALRIVREGGEYVRFTAQGEREASNLGEIRRRLKEEGCETPLVADIHFNANAADVAAQYVEKVRINPGNYVDPVKTFAVFEYSEEEYLLEIDKIRQRFVPFLRLCRERKVAIRIGVNHGSLSDRIMSRYGDTPAGMVASCMEFLDLCVEEQFYDVVISMKASNTVVMVAAVRLLVSEMDRAGYRFPLHLGVTEAGDGEDGRIKSAVGIGALLSDGIGDTIRVSLSEDPEREIPVARQLVDYISRREGHAPLRGRYSLSYDWICPSRRLSSSVGIVGGGQPPVVMSDVRGLMEDFSLFRSDFLWDGTLGDVALRCVELYCEDCDSIVWADLRRESSLVILLRTRHVNVVGAMKCFFHRLLIEEIAHPVILCLDYLDGDESDIQIRAGVDGGSLFLSGFGDGLMVTHPAISALELESIAFGVLQAVRLRITKTEFISCPGCGRTLFDLQKTIGEIKSKTSHLSHLKIGIMGCIVNGPGEMADADYGYVGAARGKVSLYKGKECVERNIDQSDALSKLIDLIKANGDWIDLNIEDE